MTITVSRRAFLVAITCLVSLPLPSYAGGGSLGSKARLQVEIKNISSGPTSSAITPPIVSIDTREVGDPNNAPTTIEGSPVGSISVPFRIGTFEVTIAEYTAFLNAVATRTDSANGSIVDSLYDSRMASDINVAGISRSGEGTATAPYVYTEIGDKMKPIAYVTWFNAARFANWMHNGATTTADTETGAYTLALAITGSIARNPNALWWIPTQDEWFKAAHYKSGGTNAGYWRYPTQSDDFPTNDSSLGTNQANFHRLDLFSITQLSTLDPNQNYLTAVGTFTNSPSAYGTFDQGGNLDEWTDTVVTTSFGEARITRGGAWSTGGLNADATPISTALPNDRANKIGFRLARAAITTTPTTNQPLTGDFDVTVTNPITNTPIRINAGEIRFFGIRPGRFTVVAQDSANPTLQATKQFGADTLRNNRVTISNAGGQISIEQVADGASF